MLSNRKTSRSHRNNGVQMEASPSTLCACIVHKRCLFTFYPHLHTHTQMLRDDVYGKWAMRSQTAENDDDSDSDDVHSIFTCVSLQH